MSKQNIIDTFNRATTETKQAGLLWYAEANAFAQGLAWDYKLSLEQVCDIIAALSPACSWEVNKADAKRIIEAYYHRGLAGAQAVTVSSYGPNKTKALNILNAGFALSSANGLKTWNFSANILLPIYSDYVTIDRHAKRVYDGVIQNGSVVVSPKEYAIIKQAYKDAAKELGLIPCQLQAVTWLQHKIEKASK